MLTAQQHDIVAREVVRELEDTLAAIVDDLWMCQRQYLHRNYTFTFPEYAGIRNDISQSFSEPFVATVQLHWHNIQRMIRRGNYNGLNQIFRHICFHEPLSPASRFRIFRSTEPSDKE